MDQKKTQRIMGIIIVIALVIVLFPLLFSKNESTPTMATIKTPPFPEPVTATDNTLAASEVTKDNIISPESNSDIKEPLADRQIHEAESVKMEQTSQSQSSPISPPINNTDDTVKTIASPAQTEAELPPPPILTSEEIIPAPKPIKKAEVAHTKKKSSHPTDPLMFNKAAWVVQMGSFKDKNNARRLTDRLRAAGFAAFTREVQAKKGTQMRVYVGPEFKQLAALKLSTKIEQEMNIHGLVIPYNPLRL